MKQLKPQYIQFACRPNLNVVKWNLIKLLGFICLLIAISLPFTQCQTNESTVAATTPTNETAIQATLPLNETVNSNQTSVMNLQDTDKADNLQYQAAPRKTSRAGRAFHRAAWFIALVVILPCLCLTASICLMCYCLESCTMCGPGSPGYDSAGGWSTSSWAPSTSAAV